MLKVKWFIEDGAWDYQDELLQALNKVRFELIDFEFVKYVPFLSTVELGWVSDGSHAIVLHGSLNLAKHVLRESTYIPGVLGDPRTFKCSKYYPYFGDLLLNSRYWMLPLGELARNKSRIFSMNGDSHALVFFRPDSGMKPFTGQVVAWREFGNFIQDCIEFKQVDPTEMVLISTPYKLSSEARFIVVDGKVIAGSYYRAQGKLYSAAIDLQKNSLANYAMDVARDVDYPERVYVLDVCELAGTVKPVFNVIEINSFSCAGWYACDKEAIIRSVSQVAMEEYLKEIS